MTIALVELVTAGAVNKPLLVIEPALADQVTNVFELFVTEAENCCVLEALRLVAAGDTEIPSAGSGSTVTFACAEALVSAVLVAFTVTEVLVVTLGAVNNPLLEMVPLEADQVTAVFDVLLTVAANCWVELEMALTVAGEIATNTAARLTGFPVMKIEIVALPRPVFAESVTLTLKLKEPEAVGVPDSLPLVLNDNPGGTVPPDTTNWYGAVPPCAVRAELYAVDTTPDGRVVGETVTLVWDRVNDDLVTLNCVKLKFLRFPCLTLGSISCALAQAIETHMKRKMLMKAFPPCPGATPSKPCGIR